MQVARDVTADDLMTLRRYLKRRPDGVRLRRYEYGSYLGVFTVVGFGILAVFFARSASVTPWLFAVSPVIGVLVCQPFWLYLDRRADARFVAGNASELGRQEFWTSDEGFGNRTPAGSTFHVWKEVVAVEQESNLLFVSARVLFYTIPRRSGADPEFEQFAADVTERWRLAKEGAVEQRVEADKARAG
jgi:hypothetical protein